MKNLLIENIRVGLKRFFWRGYKKYNKETIDLELDYFHLPIYFHYLRTKMFRDYYKKQLLKTRIRLTKDGYLTGRKSK